MTTHSTTRFLLVLLALVCLHSKSDAQCSRGTGPRGTGSGVTAPISSTGSFASTFSGIDTSSFARSFAARQRQDALQSQQLLARQQMLVAQQKQYQQQQELESEKQQERLALRRERAERIRQQRESRALARLKSDHFETELFP